MPTNNCIDWYQSAREPWIGVNGRPRGLNYLVTGIVNDESATTKKCLDLVLSMPDRVRGLPSYQSANPSPTTKHHHSSYSLPFRKITVSIAKP